MASEPLREAPRRRGGKRLQEPLPVQPFLDWCTRREEQIRREIDHYPAISGSRDGGVEARGPMNMDPRGRLVMELGWDPDTGTRRLHRWRHENVAGLVERAIVEEALFTAGVGFEEVYPEEVDGLGDGQGWPRHKPTYMTPKQLAAAHVVYMRGDLTMNDVAALIWQRHGYASQEAARCALRRGWRVLGLPVRRQCAAITRRGTRCEKAPLGGKDHCAKHDKQITKGWEMPPELIARARDMHEQGTSLKAIGELLIDETPWQHPTYVAKQIAAIARDEGWHRGYVGGKPWHAKEAA